MRASTRLNIGRWICRRIRGQSYPQAIRTFAGRLWGSFHHRHLLLAQPVQPIHDLVDQPVGEGNGPLRFLDLAFEVDEGVEVNRCVVDLERQIQETEQNIAFTDTLIDQIVYRLYGLSEEEIESVKGSA